MNTQCIHVSNLPDRRRTRATYRLRVIVDMVRILRCGASAAGCWTTGLDYRSSPGVTAGSIPGLYRMRADDALPNPRRSTTRKLR